MAMRKTRLTHNVQETEALGREMAPLLAGSSAPALLALIGGLGSGKTTFTQGLASGLGISGKIISPTFILRREYEISGFRKKRLYHLDLYRLEGNNISESLGLEEVWFSTENLIVIEWAEKIEQDLPLWTKVIRFELTNLNQRKISISQMSQNETLA